MILSTLILAAALSSGPAMPVRVPLDEPFGSPPSSTASRLPAPRLVTGAPPTNVRVNDPSQLPGPAADVTPAIAVNGDEVLVVWRVFSSGSTERLRAAFSEDGGSTYTDVGWLPSLPGAWQWGFDISVEVDPVSGTFMVAAQAIDRTNFVNGIGFITAQIGPGISWGASSIVHTTGYVGVFFIDTFSMEYDPAAYMLSMVFSDYYVSPPVTTYRYSFNHGATWSAPDTIATGAAAGAGPRVAPTYFGPVVLYTEALGTVWEPFALKSWSYLGPGLEPNPTLSVFRREPGSFPGSAGDMLSVPSVAADRTPWLYQNRAYAAWIESATLAWPTPAIDFQYEIEPNDTFDEGNLLDPASGHLSGSMSPSTEADIFHVTLDEQQHLILTPEILDGTGSAPNIRIEIFDPDTLHLLGFWVASQSDLGLARVLFTAPQPALYPVRLTGFDVSNYQLGIAYSYEVAPGAQDRRDVMTSFTTDIGQTWSSPSRLWFNGPAGFDAGLVDVAVGNDGRPYLFWLDFSGSQDGTYAWVRTTRSSDGGVTWEEPRTVSSAASDWQLVSVGTNNWKIGYRLDAATTATYFGEAPESEPVANPKRAAVPTRPRQANVASPSEDMHVVWTDARDGEGNIYTTNFSTGFEVLFAINDTTAVPGETLALRAVLQNRNTLFPEYIDSEFLACQRNWASGVIVQSFFLDPGTTSSLYPVAIHIPDTAAAGTVFFQAGLDLGSQYYGINTFIHVQVNPTAVDPLQSPLTFGMPNPNPAAAMTRFPFSLPAEGEVALEIFDVTGSRVRSLIDERLGAGSHARVWDLRDDAGRRVSPGLYLAKMHDGSRTQVRRIAVLR